MINNYTYKDIPGFEGIYAVTTDGQVWSYRRNKFLAPGRNGKGYLFVVLSVNNIQKLYRVHRLVLEVFNPVEGMDQLQVNHLDEDKTNNRLENLCWVTCKENNNYGTRNQRIGEYRKRPVRCIETDTIYDSQLEAAEAVGLCSTSGISLCCNGIRLTAAGFHWEYANKL